MVEGVCATTGVLGDECLQLSIARRWPAAFDIGIFGYDFIREDGITIRFSTNSRARSTGALLRACWVPMMINLER